MCMMIGPDVEQHEGQQSEADLDPLETRPNLEQVMLKPNLEQVMLKK